MAKRGLRKRLSAALRRRFGRRADWYLKGKRGVIHVGANTGQEAELYYRYGLNVLWIEPIPEVFATLKLNVKKYPKQVCFQTLASDSDGEIVDFNVANNGGASSSIFPFDAHVEMWPDVTYEATLPLETQRLDTLFGKEDIDLELYDALLVDTQGAELKVLKGLGDSLAQFDLLILEAADFSAYEGGCSASELTEYLRPRGFVEVDRLMFETDPTIGSYYNLIFAR